jgi:urease accessory protein
MLRLTTILGSATEPEFAGRLHGLGHHGRVEHIALDRHDSLRHRLRVRTDRGTDCAIALARNQTLFHGAVLLCDDDRAIVVRMKEERWLRLEPRDAAAALELGYFAGNLHWRARFDGVRLEIALEGPEEDYLDRLRPMLAGGVARRLDDG